MMIKVVRADGWDYGIPHTALVKLGRDGRFLGSSDRTEFLKRASASFLDVFRHVKIAADEEPLHVIAMGSTEGWGANRNGDGFKEATLRQWCPTFVKHAKWYRNHYHRNPQISYGVVKAAEYNNEMRRVELLVALNKTKEAAERNGGLVADKELNMLSKNEPISVSMACRVPYDVCDICGNKAKTRKEYCTEETCPGGGAKHNLGKIVKVGTDMRYHFVDNPDPTFHDISDVSDTRPADRTAYASGAEWLGKAAVDGVAPWLGGAEAAERLGLKWSIWDDVHPSATDAMKLAICLGRLDHDDLGLRQIFDRAGRALTRAVQPDVRDVFGKLARADRARPVSDLLFAMAKQGAILPLRDFAAVVGCPSEEVEPALAQLPGLFESKIAEEIDSHSSDTWLTDSLSDSSLSKTASQLLDEAYGLTSSGVSYRLSLADQQGLPTPVWNRSQVKVASTTALKLAVDYAAYQLHAVRLSPHHPLTARLALVQNRIW